MIHNLYINHRARTQHLFSLYCPKMSQEKIKEIFTKINNLIDEKEDLVIKQFVDQSIEQQEALISYWDCVEKITRKIIDDKLLLIEKQPTIPLLESLHETLKQLYSLYFLNVECSQNAML